MTSTLQTSATPGLLLLAISTGSLMSTVFAQSDPGIPESSTSARQMTAAAVAFIDTLRPAQRRQVVHAFTGANRSNWSNVPTYVHPRPGLRIRELTNEQRRAAHALLRASMSGQGYQKVNSVIRLDSIHGARELATLEQHGPAEGDRPFAQQEAESFGSGSYAIAVFGDPGSEPDWGWLIQGHHLAASFTVSGGRVAVTPLFLGATPLILEQGVYAGWSALSHELARGVELIVSLDGDQQGQALEAGEVPADVLYGVGHNRSLPAPSGLRASHLTAGQLRLLKALVEEYVRNADFDVADAQLAAIGDAGWKNVTFSWRGSTDDASAPLYYRVQGERVLIELSHRPNHIHAIVRDPVNDYGAQWLDEPVIEVQSADDRFEAAEARYLLENENQ